MDEYDPHNTESTLSDARLERLSRRDSAHQAHSASYSRFVRLMRLVLPLAAMAVVAVLFLRTGEDDSMVVTVEESAPEVQEQRISRNELLNPKFESMDKKSQPYTITADRAVQGEKNKDLIMLERPVGVMTMENGARVHMNSDTGAYRQDTERFFLQGGVNLRHDAGYALQSEEAHIDLKQNFAWSEKPVRGQGPDMTIDAKGVRANGETGKIVFVGPATLVLQNGFEGIGGDKE